MKGAKQAAGQVVFIGEYLLSFPGGGERSIYEELRRLSKRKKVVAYAFSERTPRGESVRDGLRVVNFGMPLSTMTFRLFAIYALEEGFIRKRIRAMARELRACEYVITQTLIAPIVADECARLGVPYRYYVRDENQANEFHNYERGVRRLLKAAKSLVETPARRRFTRMNERALKNADRVIANSRFLARLLKRRFGVDAEVRYPAVDERAFREAVRTPGTHNSILFIGGGNAMKGYDIVLRIAKRMPGERFLVVGPYSEETAKGNVTRTPWRKDVIPLYRRAKLVLVPSRWQETYGRVVIEAGLMGLPAVTSDRGGLPEANPAKELIVKEIDDVGEWVRKIRLAMTRRR